MGLQGFPFGARLDESRMMIVWRTDEERPVSDALVAALAAAVAVRSGTYNALRLVSESSADWSVAWSADNAAREAVNAASAAAYSTVEVEHRLPFSWEVCDCCGGSGTHVHRSIDAGGLTAEDLREWDEDEREGYFSGRYDVSCEDCGGRRVTACPTEPSTGSSRAHKAAWAAYCEWDEDERYSRAERAAEIRMGA
jgi:hypothetical protein